MPSGPVAPAGAGLCLLAAALAFARAWWVAPWLGAAGVAILTGGLVARGLRPGHWPLTNQYEFALAFALCLALAALLTNQNTDWTSYGSDPQEPSGRAMRWVPALSMLLAAALLAYARFVLPASQREVQHLPPALDSIWLPLHVGAAALSYGFLAVAGIAGLSILLGRRAVEPACGSVVSRTGLRLDRAASAGYPLLTLSMLLGMIWAHVAWGRYWGWDLKEVWTLVTWLIYTLYYHLRRRPRWQGRRTAWLATAGLVSVLFTFLGVSWLARTIGLESLHLF